MIKNPTIGQKVYYFVDLDICFGAITYVYKDTGNVELLNWHYREPCEIFPTKEDAKKYLPEIYAQTIKSLSKQIFKLSKEREKLATKLAKLK